MVKEYGIFDDEGCVGRQFYSMKQAQAELADPQYMDEDGLWVAEMCPDHADDECVAQVVNWAAAAALLYLGDGSVKGVHIP